MFFADWRRRRRAWRSMSVPAQVVARKGIAVGQAGVRSSTGGRFPETARLSAQKTIREAMRKIP